MPPEPPDNTPHEPPIGSINLPHNSMPFFRGGTVYWECPWSTNVYGFAAYCHVYGSNGYWLYDWQTESEKMTAAPEKGENVFKYDIPAGPYDLIIFSISTGAQTYECVLTDDCIGKIAKTDKSNMLENPLDSNRIAASTEFEGVASSGPHLAITSIGNITGKLMCPTENGEHVVAAFIKTYLGFNDAITADMLADFIPIFDTTALDVYAVLAADSEFPTFLLSDGTKMLDKAAELLGINPLGEEGRPFFKGGTIYWECPWPTDGRIFKAYCHVYGSDGSWLYDWQDSSEEMTRAPEKGENVFKYYIPTGPYDLIIFSISTGAQTYACVLNNDCIGKIAKTDKNNMLENPVDSYKYAAATEFEGVASSGPHIEITSVGNVVGKVICPTEDGASIVAMFIKNYLAINLAVNPDKMTSDTLANLVNSFDTTALDVYNILAADNKFASFTLEDGTNQLDKAAELLGIGRDKGDVNGDGTIDAKDRMFITRHIAKWQGYESINEAAADVNADGLIDAKDRMVLTRHIAKWVGYETLPYVKGAA